MADLKCSICLELYKDPRILPCLHTFCLECLKRLVVDEEDKSTITCAQCRKNHSVPDGGVVMFLQNITILLDLMEAKSTDDKTEKLVCGSCTSNDPAVAFCEMCGDLYLCNTCVSCHHRMKILKIHNVIKLDELVEHFMKFASDCPKHVGNQRNLYCKVCDTPVCTLCTRSDHTGHYYDEIDAVRSDVLSKVDTLIADARDKVHECKDAMNFTDLVENKIIKEKRRIEEEVNLKYDEIIKEVEIYRKQALDDIEEAFAADGKVVCAGRNSIELLLNEIESCLKSSDRFQSLVSLYPKIIVLTGQLLEQLKIVKKRKVAISAVVHASLRNTTFQQPDIISKASKTPALPSFSWYQPKNPLCGKVLFQFVDVSVTKVDNVSVTKLDTAFSFNRLPVVLTIKTHIPNLTFEVEEISVTRRSLSKQETHTYSSSKCILKDVESNLQQFEVTYTRLTSRAHSATVKFREIYGYRPKSVTIVIY